MSLCVVCSKTATQKCSKCPVHYCSAECQTQHWPKHKLVCQPLPTITEVKEEKKPPVLKGSVCLFLPKPGGTLPMGVYDLDRQTARNELGITEEQYKGLVGLIAIPADHYFEAMRLFTPMQRLQVFAVAVPAAKLPSTASFEETSRLRSKLSWARPSFMRGHRTESAVSNSVLVSQRST